MGDHDLPTRGQSVPASGWQDRLVELHVLADHGDRDAARAAAEWMARDERARRRWDSVQAACDRVRGGDVAGPGAAATGPTTNGPTTTEWR